MTLEPALTRIGIEVPDSAFAREARGRIVDAAPLFLVNHSIRAYAWAVELARVDGLRYDAEILYVSALLHDIGLLPEYDLGGCFETDGAIAAQRFALDHGEQAGRARAIYDVIDLHMADELPRDPASEVALLYDSTGTDVTGYRLDEVRADAVSPIVSAYPRLDFKREFAARFRDQAARKPMCSVARMVAAGKLQAIADAPFDG